MKLLAITSLIVLTAVSIYAYKKMKKHNMYVPLPAAYNIFGWLATGIYYAVLFYYEYHAYLFITNLISSITLALTVRWLCADFLEPKSRSEK